MPIQILPLQLANQIAAGEVVERPASVVKELIENSLDAGALQIEVDIENGGSQLIRIRDNGAGIAQQELALALTRHATSKITSLEDLQAVTSLGFRGEALASIHAVSRLSITSRIAQHAQAWQIYAEGRDSATRVKPVAHPLGTTLEVRDLFYNTPVRRKFLRSAKTEFAHVDEVVRRIALAHFPVGFILNHNGKRIRHYRPVAPEAVLVPRLAALCGQPFAEQALVVLWRNPLLTVTGWIAISTELKGGSDIQYSYVNGRVIRDKVINHAIRQACHEHCTAQHTPAFVLFLEIDPQQVDVNVHPTKQEVRFHHARAVHDAIYQAVCQSLSSTADPSAALSQVDIKQTTTAVAPHVQSAASILPRPPSAGSVQAVGLNQKPVAYYPDDCHQSKKWNSKKIAPYRQLLQITSVQAEKPIRESAERFDIVQCSKSTAVASCSLGRVLMVWQQQYALLERQYECALLSLPVAQRYLYQTQLVQQQGPGRGQALLIPQVLPDLSVQKMEGLQRYHPVLAQLGIKLQLQSCSVIVQALPMLLQQQDRIGLLLSVLEYLATSAQKDALDLAEWLARQLTMPVIQWHVAQAIQLLADLEHALPSVLAEPSPALLQSVDLTAASTLLAHYA